MALPELGKEEYERMKWVRNAGIKNAKKERQTYVDYVRSSGIVSCPILAYNAKSTLTGCARCRELFPHTPGLYSCPDEHYAPAGLVRRWNKLLEKYETDNNVEPGGY